MTCLRAENITKRYADRLLFENLSMTIAKSNKIAIIAKNGTGKTTLLNILAGIDTSDGLGKVILDKNCSMAYLPQQPLFEKGSTVWNALFNSNDELLKSIATYEDLIARSATDNSDALLKQLQQAMEKMDSLNAWDYEAQVKQILYRLNIQNFEQVVDTLSGGQLKRLALARILIQNPDLVIMDEPTNHLDVDMIEWLENYLQTSDITLFIVSHDRYFLDKVCKEIWELDGGKIYSYKGNYAYYMEKKAEREMLLEIEIDKAKNLYRKELEWMRRQPQARGTKQKARIDAFYETKEKAHQKIENKKVVLDVKMQRLGNKILELENINKAYGTKKIIENFTYTFKPGERIGIVGKNGIGKSTFLNILLGLESSDSGKVSTGETIVFGYYAQSGMQLKEDKRVLETVKDIAEYIELNKGEQVTATQLCKRFLFDDKMQHTYVSKLSGGEKRRLYLLTILMKNPNFLILDEPTNDLDIQTLNVLEDFLENFKGCLLTVTHDRYFMDKLADHLFVFEGNGIIRDFNGNYQDYLNEQTELKQKQKQETQKKEQTNSSKTNPTLKRKLSYKEQLELDTLEKEIPMLETKKNTLIQNLNSGSTNHEELMQWGTELEILNKELDEKGMRWLELSEL